MLPVSEGTEVRCLFMQEDISCFVTKDFSSHIETVNMEAWSSLAN